MHKASDYFPRILDYIEYYEVYPEYNWQKEKEYIKQIEYTIYTDKPDIKVSELYFDVLFKTEDVLVGIPKDYTSLVDPLLAIDFD
jgi:hypothetical protein